MNENGQNWMRLDNAAKIYPASMRRDWMAMFRLSATLVEPVDPEVLRAALTRTLRRFPWFAVRMRRGMFWYYLEHNDAPPVLEEDVRNPCVPMRAKDSRGYAFRVRYYGNQIAVEMKHDLEKKLQEFASMNDNLEEISENREQIEISRQYERLPKPSLMAVPNIRIEGDRPM